MTRKTGLWAATLCLFAAPALADVTPAQVWDIMTDEVRRFGYEVSATPTQSGGTLTLRDVVLRVTAIDGQSEVEQALGTVVLRDNGDGTVAIEMPDRWTISVEADADGKVMTFDLDTELRGFDMVASGTPDRLVIDQSVEALAVALKRATHDGVALPPEVLGFEIETDAMTSQAVIAPDRLTQSVALDGARMTVQGGDPSDPTNRGRATLSVTGLDTSTEMQLPSDVTVTDPLAALRAGLAYSIQTTHQGAEAHVESLDEDDSWQVQFASAAGVTDYRLDGDRADFQTQSNDLRVVAAPGSTPFAYDVSIGSAKLAGGAPLVVGETPAPMALLVALEEVRPSETIWQMFDPMGMLPRDPMNLRLDLEGTGNPTVDLLDPGVMLKAGEDKTLFMTLQDLTINDLSASAIGSTLAATGDLTFDTVEGMPVPLGLLRVNVTGITGTLDKLAKLKLVPEQTVMGIGMMLGQMALPGPGKDEWSSEIKLDTGGKVFVNGNRVK